MSRTPSNPFWRYSLRIWRIPGVEEACLALQERCGADVNLLLFCGWTGQQGRRLDRRALKSAISRVGAWQSDVIAPLRLARQGLKRQREGAAAALPAQGLRKRLAALELDLERVEQALLADLRAQWAAVPLAESPRQAIAASLACYLGLLAKPAGREEQVYVTRIAEACARRSRSRAVGLDPGDRGHADH
ncbi:MAG TPA: TIGR02444 family protein [Ramlibacter sp.]|nr:TIGR02444 family protein [Ramlibacter sp.]